MQYLVRKIYLTLLTFGFDARQFLYAVLSIPKFLKDYIKIRRQTAIHPISLSFYPCLGDHLASSGVANGHYFHQDLLVAQKVFAANPERHLDVGSRVDGLVSHIAVFRQIEVMDVRRLQSTTKNIKFYQCDLMSPLPKNLAGAFDSVSSLHAIEHFGLGRYGDPIDLEGYVKGLGGLYNLLKPGGVLYLSVPMGRDRIEFNAHRVFSLATLQSLVQGKYDILSFSYVDDSGFLHGNITDNSIIENIGSNFDCEFGLAIYELKKI